MENLNITGTFSEYVDSIVAEAQRLFGDCYIITTEDSFWGTATAEDGGTPCKVIYLRKNGWNTHFSIAELEFITLQCYAPDALVDLAIHRFIDVRDGLVSAI